MSEKIWVAMRVTYPRRWWRRLLRLRARQWEGGPFEVERWPFDLKVDGEPVTVVPGRFTPVMPPKPYYPPKS